MLRAAVIPARAVQGKRFFQGASGALDPVSRIKAKARRAFGQKMRGSIRTMTRRQIRAICGRGRRSTRLICAALSPAAWMVTGEKA